MRATTKRRAALAGAVIAGIAATRGPWIRSMRTRATRRLSRAWGRARGAWRGLHHRSTQGGPDPGVADTILTDRVRSELGPLEKRLDLPRAHVMVHEGIALLHGAVENASQEAAIVHRVRRVPGIRGVDSRLRVGFREGATRPSEGRGSRAPSMARRRLIEAACRSAGVDAEEATRVVGAVVTTLAERLPARERDHLVGHLPGDVRELAHHPRSPARAATAIRSVEDFLGSMRSLADLDEPVTPLRDLVVARAVLGELRALVPEETEDVAAVLPAELRELWARSER